MNENSKKNPQSNENVQVLVNEDFVTVIIDGPGDTTVLPPRPVLRKLGLETQAKIAKWQAEEKQQQARESRPQQQEPKK